MTIQTGPAFPPAKGRRRGGLAQHALPAALEAAS